ncbi:MAG: hypothetical protein JW940_26645 [Polyangiaceae bacterium]|nr:hypothetical protein [Polyangiaceae bacterium]
MDPDPHEDLGFEDESYRAGGFGLSKDDVGLDDWDSDAEHEPAVAPRTPEQERRRLLFLRGVAFILGVGLFFAVVGVYVAYRGRGQEEPGDARSAGAQAPVTSSATAAPAEMEPPPPPEVTTAPVEKLPPAGVAEPPTPPAAKPVEPPAAKRLISRAPAAAPKPNAAPPRRAASRLPPARSTTNGSGLPHVEPPTQRPATASFPVD